VTLTLQFDPLFKNFNIGHIFWMASDKAFIFHMCVPYKQDLSIGIKCLTLWPWPCSLTHFSKTLTLAISFEWQVIRLSYFICVSLWHDLSIDTKLFDLVTLKFDPLFKNFNIGHIFWMVSDRAFVFHMCVPYDKYFLTVLSFLTLWPWPWSLTQFLKTNFGHIFWMVSDRAFVFHMHVTCDTTFILEQ
jgi:hypothetical protein